MLTFDFYSVTDQHTHKMPKANKNTVEETPAGMGKNLATMPAGPGAPMEIVFSFDTTGSMNRCIAEVCQHCRNTHRRSQGGGGGGKSRRSAPVEN